jgi:hypothetical protein
VLAIVRGRAGWGKSPGRDLVSGGSGVECSVDASILVIEYIISSNKKSKNQTSLIYIALPFVEYLAGSALHLFVAISDLIRDNQAIPVALNSSLKFMAARHAVSVHGFNVNPMPLLLGCNRVGDCEVRTRSLQGWEQSIRLTSKDEQ